MRRRTPHATCRLQIHTGFTLHDARAALDHLHVLGISHLYLSPIFEARPGSTHGYDVTDPTRVRADIGGEDALRALARAAHERGMGLILDIVPNHMAAAPENPWWQDVLRNGPDSPYTRWFDITWGTGDDFPLVLPVLGVPLPEAIAAGDVRLDTSGPEPVILAYDVPYPTAPGTVDPSQGQDVESVLHRQHYRLAHWSASTRVLAYRRFFDVGDLIAFRAEEEAAYRASHAAIERWVAEGLVDGLRVDHIDGLADPLSYLQHLTNGKRVSVLVEKILARHESLPDEWPVDGTTGYEFIDRVTGLLIDRDGWERLHAHHAAFTGRSESFDRVARAARLRVIDRLFPAELDALARTLAVILDRNDVELLRTALRAVSVGLRVYRTYIRDAVRPEDRVEIEAAVRAAARHGECDPAALEALRSVLLLEGNPSEAARRFVRQWQQFTGPVMAKGFEDTALYNWAVLTAANEVGGEPGRPCIEPADVHAFFAARGERCPGSLNATATHDTKRGEDVRARIAAISEFAEEWGAAVDEWTEFTLRRAPEVSAVDPDDLLLLAQAIVGTWPFDGRVDDAYCGRLRAYAQKAVREAKRNTSWRAPDESYERAVATLVDALIDVLADRRPARLHRLLPRLMSAGAVNACAQVLLRNLAPGVPDLYQGNESWRFELVDPDNRRPVDYDALSALRRSVEKRDAASLLTNWTDGGIKLFLTKATLQFRAAHPDLLKRGRYIPLAASGTHADRVFAFLREHEGSWCLAAVPRCSAHLAEGFPLGDVWSDTMLVLPREAPRRWRSVLTRQPFEGADGLGVAYVLSELPVALLSA